MGYESLFDLYPVYLMKNFKMLMLKNVILQFCQETQKMTVLHAEGGRILQMIHPNLLVPLIAKRMKKKKW
jgi:hypothetical protein